ncbi:alkyl/aryl-sulfatase [Bacillus mycoides]|uniref:Beta-lactamase domain protein n=1 Tax=Bacillus mycoides (strain KBAB4) TaxID=315730 RepID=A9VV89_BACMK|nr:alkyl sulfatase dimerization domain-containing protein [Bacillus mycoides]ABY46521.1 beta-lactamase domain protein [Bacillus mycoides KBAB4]
MKITQDPKDATNCTTLFNKQVAEDLNINSETEYALAIKNLVEPCEELVIMEDNKIIWSQKAYQFLEKDEWSSTVNPSLWCNGKNNHVSGLFKVTEEIYQVRGFDMANMTMVLTPQKTWVMLDTLMSTECTIAALNFADTYFTKNNLPKLIGNIRAIIMSHSHVDHFGGVNGIFTYEEQNPDIPIYAPKGFTEHAVSENIYAGNAMARRAAYQYGSFLDAGKKGSISIGIGQTQSKGTISFRLPTHEITENQSIVIDDLKLTFQLTPGAEAPAEMNTHFPKYRALWLAENCSGTLHNLYTLRGAQVRDGNAWGKYLLESISLFADETDVTFQAHNWPHWNTDDSPNMVREHITVTAAAYKFINDQTLLYINQGYTSTEIADKIQLPTDLAKYWYIRPYYGTPKHNAKAVYQKYMGWYDANPANLDPLPNVKRAEKLIDYMGGSDAVIEKSLIDFENGNYQFVADIMSTLVFADPNNQKARFLAADALEQLGYQSESGIWRNAYLSGAYELRNGTVTDPTKYVSGAEITEYMTGEMILDYLGILIDGDRCSHFSLEFNLIISDDIDLTEGSSEYHMREYILKLYQGTVLYFKDTSSSELPTVTMTRQQLLSLTAGSTPEKAKEIAESISDDPKVIDALVNFMSYITQLSEYRHFNIIEP